jgi:hypothetical protein
VSGENVTRLVSAGTFLIWLKRNDDGLFVTGVQGEALINWLGTWGTPIARMSRSTPFTFHTLLRLE